MKYCAACLRKLTYHETVKCRRCKTALERAEWLRVAGKAMNEFKMETTGSTSLDETINKYR